MHSMNTILAAVSELSLFQTLASLGLSGGTIWGAWKWYLSSRIDTLKLANETSLRYRELEESRRNKFQADVMTMVETIRAENKELRTQLFESEDARLKLIHKIGELQTEIAELKSEIIRLTTELVKMRGVPNHAANG